MFEEIKKVTWYFPPSKNKNGETRRKYDEKMLILIETDIINSPCIITSDLHGHTQRVFNLMDKYINLDKFTVLCAGDMAGTWLYGTDGDPTEFYEYMLSKCQELFFVAGNHDKSSSDKKNREKRLSNKNNTQCHLDGNGITMSCIGSLAGINGTISNRCHEYKFPLNLYCEKLEKILKMNPKIVITHDTPALPIKNENNIIIKTNGTDDIFNITSKYKPHIHIYGHCHHKNYHSFINETHYICADSRILILIPNKLNYVDFFKEELNDEYDIYDYYS